MPVGLLQGTDGGRHAKEGLLDHRQWQVPQKACLSGKPLPHAYFLLPPLLLLLPSCSSEGVAERAGHLNNKV